MKKTLENYLDAALNFLRVTKKHASNLKYVIPFAPFLFINSCKQLPVEPEMSGLDLQAYMTSDTSIAISWNKLKDVDKYNIKIYARRPLFGMSGGGVQEITKLGPKDSTYIYIGTLPKNNFSVSVHALQKDSLVTQQIMHIDKNPSE